MFEKFYLKKTIKILQEGGEDKFQNQNYFKK